MLFGGNQTRDEILNLVSSDRQALDNLVAMANVGAAFSEICVFEDLVGSLCLISRVELQQRLDAEALSASQLLLDRHKQIRSSTLGRLVTALEKSGISGRDIRYLRNIVDLRNDFVHRLTEQVPLPGDWARYDYSIEQFAEYTRFVLRHISSATHFFSRIMHRHGLVAGKFGSFGAILWNPDDPDWNEREEGE